MVGTISIQIFTGKSHLLFLHITTQDNRDRKEKVAKKKKGAKTPMLQNILYTHKLTQQSNEEHS